MIKLTRFITFIIILLADIFKPFESSFCFASANQITVTATVLEHITYQTQGTTLSVITNSDTGFWILNENISYQGNASQKNGLQRTNTQIIIARF